MEKEEIKEKLIKAGINPTIQRILIYSFLLKHCDTHYSAEELFKEINKVYSGISRATIYNTMNLFSESKIITCMSKDNHEIRYDILTEEHGHFVCKICDKIFNIDLGTCIKNKKLEGFEIEEMNILLKGVCKDCSLKGKEIKNGRK